MVQASWETSFVVIRSTNSDRIVSFGSNEFGLLGIGGDNSNVHGIQDVKLAQLFSSDSDNIRITKLKAGPRNAFAVVQHQTSIGQREMLIGWGAGRHGQLQMREMNDAVLRGPRQVALPMRVMTWAYPTEVIDLSVGSQHTLVLTNDGKVYQLGSNAKHQLPNDLHPGQMHERMDNWDEIEMPPIKLWSFRDHSTSILSFVGANMYL
ncbi:hypothetical protein FRC17_010537 [Serendipita sp. 399]|nr:hypothetical protein FRC17_010537 [Serendipita sp. 399]